MRRRIAGILALVACAACALALEAGEAAKESRSLGHRFLCADFGGNKVYLVNEAGEIEWEYKTRRPQDVAASVRDATGAAARAWAAAEGRA